MVKSFDELNSEFANRSMRESKAYPNADLVNAAAVVGVVPDSLVTLDRGEDPG
jgi:hypothetical protein